MSRAETHYQGTENLEVMEQARNYNGWLAERLFERAKSGASVLDFGAGSGTFARRLSNAGYRVTCVEPDDVLRARLTDAGLEAFAGTRDLGTRRFDLVYSLNVLEHIEDDGGALRSLSEHVAPSGSVVIYVPAFQVLYTSMDRKVGHIRRYRAGELRTLAAAAGLDVHHLRYADSLGFLATLAYRAVGPSDGTIDVRSVAAYDSFVFPVSSRLDRLTGRLFGKNLLMVAVPSGTRTEGER